MNARTRHVVAAGDPADTLVVLHGFSELAAASVDYCTDARLERHPDATHWVAHEYPERVAADLIEHLDGPRESAAGRRARSRG